MRLEYMTLYSLYCDMFRHNITVIGGYIPRLQSLIIDLLYILLLVLISVRLKFWLKYMNFCNNFSVSRSTFGYTIFRVHKM